MDDPIVLAKKEAASIGVPMRRSIHGVMEQALALPADSP